MSWQLCTSASAIAKAGTHASVLITNYANAIIKATLDTWSDECEGEIAVETNTDWSGSYVSLDPLIKGCLADTVSSKIAMRMIAYDTTGYLTREADTLMNMHDEIITKGVSALKGKPNTLKTP